MNQHSDPDIFLSMIAFSGVWIITHTLFVLNDRRRRSRRRPRHLNTVHHRQTDTN